LIWLLGCARHDRELEAELIDEAKYAYGGARIAAPRRVQVGYYFYTFWLALASVVPFIILAANVAGAIFFVWPVAALWILIAGIRRTMRLGITVEGDRRSVKVDNWLRTEAVGFDAIRELCGARVIVGAPRYAGPVYMQAILRRDGSKLRIGAA
jgi:hypothetical protein